MILRYYFILSILLFLTMLRCGSPAKHHEVEERERAVLLREQKMAAVESEYEALLNMRDSIQASMIPLPSDTLLSAYHWPETLIGDWNSKMICRTSGCSNYVIGDQRNELWRFQSDSTGVYVQVISKDQEVRRFKGEYDGQQVVLSLITDNTTGVKYSRRAVLNHVAAQLVSGSQYLVGQDQCETVFSVELTPRKK